MSLLNTTAFAPFKEPLFRKIWTSSFVSNIGTWMQNVGVSWLSATMSASPLIISLIQTASSLPALLFSYLAGVTADRRDKRKLMIGVQSMPFRNSCYPGIPYLDQLAEYLLTAAVYIFDWHMLRFQYAHMGFYHAGNHKQGEHATGNSDGRGQFQFVESDWTCFGWRSFNSRWHFIHFYIQCAVGSRSSIWVVWLGKTR